MKCINGTLADWRDDITRKYESVNQKKKKRNSLSSDALRGNRTPGGSSYSFTLNDMATTQVTTTPLMREFEWWRIRNDGGCCYCRVGSTF